MLGPARFDHIETCTREVCRTFRLKDDMATYVATLTSLDDILASLRAERASLAASTKSTESSAANGTVNADTTAPKRPSYAALEESLDIAKAKRLISARENSIKSVKLALQKAQGPAS